MRLHAPRWLRDWLILAALVLLAATIALVAMVSYSNLSDTRPLLGIAVYTLVPMFFVVGGVIFYLGLHRWARGPGKYPVLDLNEPYLRRRVQFFLAAGVVELGLLMVGGFELLEFTDSPAFCGSLCHKVMAPEYKTYQASPHARVACTDCHVGKGGSWLVKSKIQGLPLTVATVFNTYSHPITSPVESLRPARDTCEQCHWPQKFTQDRLRVTRHFLPDEKNTPQTVALAFKVGGGHAEQARDIHWHIASNVWYLPLDDKRREIAWVGVEEKEGGLTEYFNPQFEDRATPELIARGKRRMDCVDCHNRATHIFRSPDQLVDEAMALGRIDASLPFVKKLALEALEPGDSPSLEAAQSRINRIEAFYRLNYPQLAQGKERSIAQALAELNRLTQFVIFPDMKVTWQTHSNFLTHDGCFRCHGELSTRPASAPRVVPVGCNLCHYQVPPEIAGTAAERARPVYQLAPPPLPHKTEGWEDCLVCHGTLGFKRFTPSHVGRTNQTCLVCHNSPQPGGGP
ncbi:MAG: NapC/NirT family cytochrome c [Chloroflexi bacterium]|nr:NapC/NirT family cytochrome c [Chloroflexota bacterium]